MVSRRGFATVAIVYVIAMAGGTFPIPLYATWMRELHFGALGTTLVFAVYALGVAAALLLVADASDRIGRRSVMLGAIVLLAVSTALFMAASSLTVLLIARALFGLGVGAAAAAANAWLVELAGSERSAVVAPVSTAATTGGLGIGSAAAGLVVAAVPDPARILFLAYLVVLAVAALAIALTPETVTERRTWRPALRRPELPPPSGRPAFTGALVAVFAAFAVNGLFSSVIPAAMRSRFGVEDPAAVGALVSIVFASALVAQLAPRPRVLMTVPVASALLAVGVIGVQAGFLLGVPELFFAGEAIAGAGVGLTFRRGIALAQRLAGPRDRAAVVATFFLAAYAGTALPTIALGALATAGGLATATTSLAGVVLALIAAAALAGLHRRRPAAEQETP